MNQKTKIIICSIVLFLLLLLLGTTIAIQSMAQNVLRNAVPDYKDNPASKDSSRIEALEKIKKANQEAKANASSEDLEEKERYQQELKRFDQKVENLAKEAFNL